MLISLYSDTNYSLDGFVASYIIQNCTEACSAHGVCRNGHCQCERNWKGPSCDIEICPRLCGFGQIEKHGICDYVSYNECVVLLQWPCVVIICLKLM